MKFSVVNLLGIFLIIGLLGGCTSTDSKPQSEGAEAYYEEAEEAYKDGRYITALEKYRELKNKFPYSQRATDAELRIADTLFEQENYFEAAASYETFRELHPSHPKMDFVQYRIGMSYFDQVPENSARDLSAAYRAIDAFNVLSVKYPGSEYAAKGKENLKIIKLRLAEHENYVADFYFDRKHYLSASGRYEALLKEFPDMGFDEKALYRLGECYFNTYMYSNAKDAFGRLLKRYPDSSHKIAIQSYLTKIESKTN